MLRNELIIEGKIETKNMCVCVCAHALLQRKDLCRREEGFGCMCVDSFGRRELLCVSTDI